MLAIKSDHDTSDGLYGAGASLLLMDDDASFRNRLSRAMTERGFQVCPAENLRQARAMIAEKTMDYAVLERCLGDGNGLSLVEPLKDHKLAVCLHGFGVNSFLSKGWLVGLLKDCRIIMLTGYGALVNAVAAIKAGAVDCLAKPVDADDVTGALLVRKGALPEPPENPMTPSRVRWDISREPMPFVTTISPKQQDG